MHSGMRTRSEMPSFAVGQTGKPALRIETPYRRQNRTRHCADQRPFEKATFRLDLDTRSMMTGDVRLLNIP